MTDSKACLRSDCFVYVSPYGIKSICWVLNTFLQIIHMGAKSWLYMYSILESDILESNLLRIQSIGLCLCDDVSCVHNFEVIFDKPFV